MNRRDFSKMVLAAMGGILTGATLGCQSTGKDPGGGAEKNSCKGKDGCKSKDEEKDSCKGKDGCKSK